jgi:RND family efflux transporter MFP subunit
MERTVAATGSLLAQDQATLSIKVPGRLSRLDVDLGQSVRQGDVLAQVDPQDYELRLRQAQAGVAQARAALGLPLEGTNDVVRTEEASLVRQAQAVLDEATKNRDRVNNLAKAGVAAASEVDATHAAYLVALNRYESSLEEARTRQAALHQRRAELDLAAKQLSDTRLRAPFDGAIQGRLANLGEFLATGSPVVLLVRTDPLRLRVEVPERHALAVHPGQALRLQVEGHTNAIPGRIARVSPAITETTRMLIVEADLPNDGSLRPGLFVRADLVTRGNDPGLAVPAEALVVFAGIEKVLTVRDGKAVEKTVVSGRRASGWVEILSGLKPGDPVVLNPGNLRTGQPVTPGEPPAAPTPAAARPQAP